MSKPSSRGSGCLLGWLLGSGDGSGAPSDGPGLPKIQLSTRFLSPAEKSFFQVMRQQVLGPDHLLLAQVALNQLLFLPGSNKTNPGRSTWENKLARRSIDFLVVDAATLTPRVAIELDDQTHTRPARQQRDEEVAQALEAAVLPLVRVLASETYSMRELTEALAPHLS